MVSTDQWPEPKSSDYIVRQFDFKDGSSLPELRLHYRTLGTQRKDKNGNTINAILLLHGTTGSGAAFFQTSFAGQLFNRSQPLSADKYYLIFPDSIGHGQSSKPSDGLRAKFPRYGYADMVRAHHILLTQHLNINHLRLVLGTSMGGMHTWVWATTYPDFMDALMPIASLPAQIAGRNWTWRSHIVESIRGDPGFEGGNYTSPPRGFIAALNVMSLMVNSPLKWQKAAPTREKAKEFMDAVLEKRLRTDDPNDFAYAFDASWDFDPRPRLKDVKAPLTAVNSADDQINPPELRILETEVQKMEDGRAVVLPISDKTNGHGTMMIAECWVEYLVELLQRSEKQSRSRL